MVAAYTSDELLSRVKARCQIPATEGRLSDSEIYAIADDVMLTSVGRDVYDSDDGRWCVTASDVAITAGTATYRIPSRAYGGNVDQVSFVDASGNEWSSGYVDREEIPSWTSGGTASEFYRFTLEGDHIRVLPTPSQSVGYIRVRYQRDPSRLVAVSACGLVTTKNATTITISAAPAGFGSTLTVDVVEGTPSGDTLMLDASATRTTTVITISAGVNSEVAAGDYVCLAGETCIPPLPRVAFPWLVAKCSHETLIALGDMEGARALEGTVLLRRQEVRDVLAERSRTRPKVINRNSPMRTAGMPRRARWGL